MCLIYSRQYKSLIFGYQKNIFETFQRDGIKIRQFAIMSCFAAIARKRKEKNWFFIFDSFHSY